MEVIFGLTKDIKKLLIFDKFISNDHKHIDELSERLQIYIESNKFYHQTHLLYFNMK